MVGQLLPDRLPGNRHRPCQALCRGFRLRHLQPRQLRSGLRTGQDPAHRRRRWRRVATGAGKRLDSYRTYHLPAGVRCPAPVGAVTVVVRSQVRSTGPAAAAVLPRHSFRVTVTVTVTVTIAIAVTTAILPRRAAIVPATAVHLLPRDAERLRHVHQAHGYVRAIAATHDVLPDPGRTHTRFDKTAKQGIRTGRFIQGLVRPLRSKSNPSAHDIWNAEKT